jgi:CheY-specific phosphatase CheX
MEFADLGRRSLDEACSDLLSSWTGHDNPTAHEHRVAAVIGFCGDRLRGTLGVATCSGALLRLLREFGSDTSHGDPEDCLGELANLVLGHMKRTWSQYGVEVSISTPLVVRGLAIEVCGQDHKNWIQIQLRQGPDRISIWLDAQAEPGLVVQDEPNVAGLVSGGESIMF